MQLIFLILISCGLAASLNEKEIEQEWWKFKQNYGKTYRNLVEYNKRFTNYKENLKLIIKHNRLYENGETTYKMGINAYSDKDFKEMESSYMGSKIDESFLDYNFDAEIFKPSLSVRILPKSLDWRSSGAVTKVKNQGSCGSCWAFSAIGAMESHYFLKTKNLTLLSEQNLVDCDTQSFGCSGGYKHLAFNYIRDNGGINTEESYPYVAKQQNCTFKRENIGATCRGYIRLPSGNETSLLEAVATKGPIAVSIEVTRNFQNYKTGVFNDTTCGNRTNHGVLLVGYGSVNGSDYWLVKNSWGTSWGEQGYIKMSRNKNNQCFIASYGFYPLI